MSGTSATEGVASSAHFTQQHQEALEIEFQLYTALIKRHRLSHGRTKYYQRMSMILQFLNKGPTLINNNQRRIDEGIASSNNGALSWFGRMGEVHNTYNFLENRIEQQEEENKRQRKREDIFWEFIKDKASKKHHDAKVEELRQEILSYNESVVEFYEIISNGMVEGLSRIEYAAAAMFPELARGYFLPFGTVAVGCLARIRALLLAMSTEIIQETTNNPKFQLIKSSPFRINCAPDHDLMKQEEERIRSSMIKIRDLVESSHLLSQGKWDILGLGATSSEKTSATLQSLGINGIYSRPIIPDNNKHVTTDRENDPAGQYKSASATTSNQKKYSKACPVNSVNFTDKDEDEGWDDGNNHSATAQDIENASAFDFGNVVIPRKSEEVMELDDSGRLARNLPEKHHELDRNAIVLDSLKVGSKIKAENRKKKKKKMIDSNETDDDQPSKKQKRKKSKEKKVGDFFDQLFG